jgi:hypothetical protein
LGFSETALTTFESPFSTNSCQVTITTSYIELSKPTNFGCNRCCGRCKSSCKCGRCKSSCKCLKSFHKYYQLPLIISSSTLLDTSCT